MHKITLAHARRFVLAAMAVFGLFALTGCDMSITNLTSGSLPDNPSQIYTLSVQVHPTGGTIVRSSVSPRIVIDGQVFPMHKSAIGGEVYDFDYQLPPGREDAAYYFIVKYQYDNNGTMVPAEKYTQVYKVKIAKRYVLTLEAGRGPIGARLSVLGRGFTAQDTVYFGNTPAKTTFESGNALAFIVPAVEANKNYPVTVGGSAGNSNVGTFRVDPASVQVEPSSLSLRTGERQTVSFTIPAPAPVGGMLLDVTTDVPESVIMPEVTVPAGSTSASISVQGGKPGTGALYLKGYGTNGEVTIPVSVSK